MSILTEGKQIWISKKAHKLIINEKKAEEESTWRVVDRLFNITTEESK